MLCNIFFNFFTGGGGSRGGDGDSGRDGDGDSDGDGDGDSDGDGHRGRGGDGDGDGDDDNRTGNGWKVFKVFTKVVVHFVNLRSNNLLLTEFAHFFFH